MSRFASRADMLRVMREHVATYAGTPQDRPYHALAAEALTEWAWSDRGWRAEREIQWASVNTRLAALMAAYQGDKWI